MAIQEEMYKDGVVQGELTVIPGFRFYPTEEELVGFYLKKRIQGSHQLNFDIIIPTLDLYRYDPCQLPGLANDVGERQWFFFVPRESKRSARPNRLTVSGYWKATGSDRAVRNGQLQCIGLKKTLVFYMGKAPLGQKTDWIMNEYRMPDLSSSALPEKKTDMVLCRIYRKAASQKSMEQRITRDHVDKGKLVFSAGDESEEKGHSITLNSSSRQSNPMTEAKVPTLYYNENKKVVYCSNVSKMGSNLFECLEPAMSFEETMRLNVEGTVPTSAQSYIQLGQRTVTKY